MRVERGTLPGGGVRCPFIDLHAAASGPTVAVVANLHGDECTGVGVIHALAASASSWLVAGRVWMVPSLNPDGLFAGVRGLPGESVDLNRVFPGGERGSRIEQHAARIWAALGAVRPDAALDLHTDSGGAIPYALLDRLVGGGRGALIKRCRVLAEATGLTVLNEYPHASYRRFHLDHSLTGALLNRAAMPAVTLEIGPRRRLDSASVRVGVDAVLGMLSAMGVARRPAHPHPTRRLGGPWRRHSGPTTSQPGLLCPLVSAGQEVGVGTPLAEVRAVDGTVLELLVSRVGGFVVSLPDLSVAPAGLACATLAIRDR